MASRLDPDGEPVHTLATNKGTVMNCWIGPLIALVAACALAAPAGAQTAIKPAIVYSTGGKFDKSFNEGVSQGAEKFKKETSIAIAEFEPTNETQFEQAHRRFAQRGQDPIVAVGFSQGVALEKVAKEFPNIHFTIIDSVVDLPNVQSVVFKEHEGSFLVGVLAAQASKSGKIGFVGGMDIPLIRRFQCGFEQGIKYANPKAELIANMTGTTPAAWNDPGPRRRARQGPVRPRRRCRLCRRRLDRHRRAAGRQGSRQARHRRRFQPEPSPSRHHPDLDAEAGRSRGLQQLQGGAGRHLEGRHAGARASRTAGSTGRSTRTTRS